MADAFLGGAFLFYWGCPNLGEYFPSESFFAIDRDDPDAAAVAINTLLDNNHYQKVKPAVETARNLVLDRYNLFAELVRHVRTIAGGDACSVSLHEESYFQGSRLLKARRSMRKLVGKWFKKS